MNPYRLPCTPLLHVGLAALLAAGCGANPPAPSPGPAEVEIGYGTQQARDHTGAVSSISGERLRRQRVTRVEDLLQGRFPGVMVTRLPDGSLSVRVRGVGAPGGEPLFVIDGMPVHGNRPGHPLDGIVPSDIARIDVLRDAASTAIYGSRGAHGVVLITTRRR